VLLARLQGEDVARPPVDVQRLPHDPPREPPDVVQPGRDEAEVRTAVVEVVAENLPLADRDVGS
jgi:hypothetical protein